MGREREKEKEIDLHVTWSDLCIIIFYAYFVSMGGNLFNKCLDDPTYKLWCALLNFANLLIRLHDRLDALQGQLLSVSLFHFFHCT